MNIKFIISFEVNNNDLSKFEEILNSVKSELPKVNGCLGVSIYKSSASLNEFTLVETWKTKEDHEKHVDHLVKEGSWETISKLLLSSPKSDYFTEV